MSGIGGSLKVVLGIISWGRGVEIKVISEKRRSKEVMSYCMKLMSYFMNL